MGWKWAWKFVHVSFNVTLQQKDPEFWWSSRVFHSDYKCVLFRRFDNVTVSRFSSLHHNTCQRVLSFHSFFALLHILLKILRTQPDQPSQCSAFFLDIQTNWHSLKLNFFRFHCIPNYKLTYQYHQIYPCHHPTLRINQSISMEINLFPRIERSKRCQTSTPLTIVKIKLLI